MITFCVEMVEVQGQNNNILGHISGMARAARQQVLLQAAVVPPGVFHLDSCDTLHHGE